MKIDKMMKTALSIIGFPFTLANLYINQKNKVAEIGEVLQLNDRKIHTIVTGNKDAEVTVILDAGLSCCSLDWYHIQPEVSKFARVVSFDRAGFGWSSPTKGKNTSEEVVRDLVQVLETLSIDPPYILVGHSFGGLNMRLFASRYPEKVVGLVLIDAVHESRYIERNWGSTRKKAYKQSLLLFRLGYITSGIGLPRLINQAVGRKNLPQPFQKYIDYIGYQPKAFEAVYKEFFYSEQSAIQVATAAPLKRDLPITIISSNNSDPTWIEHQKLLCGLSTETIQMKTNDGHSIHLENPELIVAEIKKVVESQF